MNWFVHLLNRLHYSPKAAVVLMTVAFVSISGGFGSYSTWVDHSETVAEVEQLTAKLARLLEEHAVRTLDATDLALLRFLDQIEDHSLIPLANSSMGPQILAKLVKNAPQTGKIFAADAQGRVVLSSTGEGARRYSVADTDYFQALKAGTEFFIGKVAKDEETGAYAFILARRIEGPTGFGGIVAASIETAYFRAFYQELGLGRSPGLGVYKMDGAILVREPLKEDEIGRNMAKNPVYTVYLPKAPVGLYHGRSAYDGVVRIVAYRKVDGPDLLVWVALSLDDALDEFWGRAKRNIAIGIAGLLLILGLAGRALSSISKEREAARALERSNQFLARSNSELQRFAEIAAHHLQEPLRNIASFAQLVEKRYAENLDADAREFIGYMVSGAHRMKALLTDLQEYVSLDITEPPKTNIDCNAALMQALEGLDILTRATHAQVTCGELPTLPGDARQIGLLFHHLLHNALEYRMPTRAPDIRVTAERHGANWHFAVADNGIGIEANYLSRIFVAFEHLSARGARQGTGIGLSICAKIVQRHGGRIWAESDLGRGTTFHFFLPATA